ncbi:hypothetical protein ACA910_019750 [Epithemia clementina (nom. ined.)]
MTWDIGVIENHLPQATWEAMVDHHVPAGMMLGVLFVALSYPIVNNVYMKKSERFRTELSRDQQVVVVQHTIEAIFLFLFFGPLSYVVLSMNFQEQSLEDIDRKVPALATMMFVIIIMYLVEIAARYQKLRTLVVAHHLCAYLDSIFPAFFLTTANLKASSLLVYFITYEAPIFVGLVLYRLCPNNKWTRPTLLVGMIVFGVSRPVQLVWILASLIVTWEHLIVWQAIAQIVLTLLFTSLQLYSLTIHMHLYKKCGTDGAKEQTSNSLVETTNDIKKPATDDEESGLSKSDGSV